MGKPAQEGKYYGEIVVVDNDVWMWIGPPQKWIVATVEDTYLLPESAESFVQRQEGQ